MGYAPLESFGLWEDSSRLRVRPRNHVHRNQLADAPRGGGARVGRGLDRADVAAHEHGDVAGADVFLADEHDVGGLHHRVGRFDRADQAPRFHHPKSIHARTLTYCCTCHNCCTIRAIRMRKTVALSCSLLCSRRALAGCSGNRRTSRRRDADADVQQGSRADRQRRHADLQVRRRADATFDKDYCVFVHVLDPDGEQMWTDDHLPPTPTEVEGAARRSSTSARSSSRTIPYIGEAHVRLGLYDQPSASAWC
jgi:hypothetical protein